MSGYIMWLREFVGAQPIILTGSVVIVTDPQGRILLQRRSDNGLWGFPGGSMELGESFEDAARREALEETGLQIGELQLIGLDSGRFYEYPNGHQVYNAIAVFTCSDFHGDIRADGEESLDVGFFPPSDLPGSISPPDQNIFDMWRKWASE